MTGNSTHRAFFRPGLTLNLALCLMFAATLPVAADWLVTVDGARIETVGPWTERGKLVVFEDADGTLTSLRLSEIDLEASHRVTREMAMPPARSTPAAPPPRPSVYRITDEDVRHVDDDEYFGATEDASAAEGAGAAGAAAPLIEVVAWERDAAPAGDGIEVRATLENRGEDVAVAIEVSVAVFDTEGVLIATAPAQLAASGLAPGQTTDMVANFPGLFDFTSVNFDIQQRAMRTRPTENTPELGEDFGAGDEGG